MRFRLNRCQFSVYSLKRASLAYTIGLRSAENNLNLKYPQLFLFFHSRKHLTRIDCVQLKIPIETERSWENVSAEWKCLVETFPPTQKRFQRLVRRGGEAAERGDEINAPMHVFIQKHN